MHTYRLVRSSFLLAAALVLAVAGQPRDAAAQSQTAEVPRAEAHKTSPDAAVSDSRPYFIEFRSRNAASYGHAFVLFGRNGTKGTIAGLHPAGDRPDCNNCSVVPWTIGHLVPVPAETGPSDGDDEPELYLTARYRVRLTPVEYRKVVGYIKKKQAETKTWNAVTNNCTHFIGDIADYMGLKTPPPIGIFATRIYVEQLAELNGGAPHKWGKLPVALMRDAPTSFVASAGRDKTRAAN